MKRGTGLLIAGLVAGVFSVTRASAQQPAGCEPSVGRLVSVQGSVELRRGEGDWQEASLDAALCQRDSVRVGALGRAAIALINDAVLRLDQNTTVQLIDIVPKEREERSILGVISGFIQSLSRKPRRLAFNTPYLNATIEGTELAVRVGRDQTEVTVFEGRVVAANDLGEVTLGGGEAALAKAGAAPVSRVVVRPRDAVQWALFYPPVLAAPGPGATGALAEAARSAARGAYAEAVAALERIPPSERTAEADTYRAALLLNVGRVEAARAAIARALERDPSAGPAYALRAVIAVAQNDNAQAARDAAHAVELAPASAAAQIALSYADQAAFRLEPARAAAQAAVAAEPQNALARARLAEIELMLGNRSEAVATARQAIDLDPQSARAQIVLGFAALAEFDTVSARQAFTRAIALSPADPMPRLGLGLALIRDGALAEGRREIEIAAGLDPSNALVRAYLGKSYFEEKRAPLDAEQFDIAKALDPRDPTPYLYDAIRLQTENQPGKALDELQASIARNDNRAVYRSRLLLDQDRAARGTSLARVYDDLGFTELGLREASKSLSLDPSNAAAHRFLSDSYQAGSGREIARVSELLQAQLLQDVNINPVQPSLSSTNLNIVTSGGPAEAGFNEFTPLFERNRAQLNASGLVGDNDTRGGEAVVSGVYDRFSISAGAFGYETDGFRPNDDLDHQIYNVFGQAAVTPDINIQAEFRHRETTYGDLEFAFDPKEFAPNARNSLDQDVARFGARYSPAPHSDVLLSYIYSKRKDHAQDAIPSVIFIPPGIPVPVVFDFDAQATQKSDQLEGQYIFRRDMFNVLAGFGYSTVDVKSDIEITLGGSPIQQIPGKSRIKDYRGYIYANIKFPETVTWTAGLSYTDFRDTTVVVNDVQEWSPKVGVQWDVTSDLRFRAAFSEGVKPPLATSQTLEPTQIAGFNQFFDDSNGTKSRRYGIGADWQVTPDVAVGAEATWREVDEPFFDTTVTPAQLVIDPFDEQRHQIYLYWTPLAELAVRTGVVYDKFKRDSDAFADRTTGQNPLEMETVTVPLNATYFHRSGFFVGGGIAYVAQDVRRLPQFANQGDDHFAVVDVGIGFRFPNRLGIASLQVRNLFDEKFKFQDNSFRERRDEPTIGPYTPERTVIGRLTLNF